MNHLPISSANAPPPSNEWNTATRATQQEQFRGQKTTEKLVHQHRHHHRLKTFPLPLKRCELAEKSKTRDSFKWFLLSLQKGEEARHDDGNSQFGTLFSFCSLRFFVPNGNCSSAFPVRLKLAAITDQITASASSSNTWLQMDDGRTTELFTKVRGMNTNRKRKVKVVGNLWFERDFVR